MTLDPSVLEILACQDPGKEWITAATVFETAQPGRKHRVVVLGLEDPPTPIVRGHDVIARSRI
jgi:hypothetical protein